MLAIFSREVKPVVVSSLRAGEGRWGSARRGPPPAIDGYRHPLTLGAADCAALVLGLVLLVISALWPTSARRKIGVDD